MRERIVDAVNAARILRRARRDGINGFPRALVDDRIDLDAEDVALLIRCEPVMDRRGMALAGIFEHLVARQLVKYRSPRFDREHARDDARVERGVLLAAEAAADNLTDNADLALRHVESSAQCLFRQLDRVLRAVDRDTALHRVGLGERAVRLEIGVIEHRGLIPVVHNDVRVLERRFHVALADEHLVGNVSLARDGVLSVEHRRVLAQHIGGAVIALQRFIFNLDERNGLLGGLEILRRHESDGVALIKHLVLSNDGLIVDHAAVAVLAGKIVCGHHDRNARQRRSFGCIDAKDLRVAIGRVECLGMEHIPPVDDEISGILCRPRRFRQCVGALHAPADIV